jgi:hypothetical protein
MSDELKPLPLDATLERRLPLGFRRIYLSESVFDEETSQRLIVRLEKYRHSSMYVRGPRKPISKPDL